MATSRDELHSRTRFACRGLLILFPLCYFGGMTSDGAGHRGNPSDMAVTQPSYFKHRRPWLPTIIAGCPRLISKSSGFIGQSQSVSGINILHVPFCTLNSLARSPRIFALCPVAAKGHIATLVQVGLTSWNNKDIASCVRNYASRWYENPVVLQNSIQRGLRLNTENPLKRKQITMEYSCNMDIAARKRQYLNPVPLSDGVIMRRVTKVIRSRPKPGLSELQTRAFADQGLQIHFDSCTLLEDWVVAKIQRIYETISRMEQKCIEFDENPKTVQELSPSASLHLFEAA